MSSNIKLYYIQYIGDFKKQVVMTENFLSSNHKDNFPNNEEEMKLFIDALEEIYPKYEHKLERYVNLLKGLNILKNDELFRWTDKYSELKDYIIESALNDLYFLIYNYPMTEDKARYFKNFIEELNDELGFSGVNSEVYQVDDEFVSTIEGNNFTTLTIDFVRDDLYYHYYADTLKEFVLREYRRRINDFEPNDTFDELYDNTIGYRASEFIRMLEDDKEYFNSLI